MRRITASGMALLATWALASTVALADDSGVKDYTWFVDRLIDLNQLPVLEDGVTCKQFSSYDRKSRYDEATGKYVNWAANGDSGHYVRTDKQSGEAVMAEMDGPGCIWRIWSANPQGKIRFYLDGAEKPTYEFDFDALFAGKIKGFPRPLVWQRRADLGGKNPASNCYLPIPYAKSCKVTADRAHKQYYHIGYTTYPKEWKVKTFSLDRTPEEEAALQRACKILSKCGEDPQPSADASILEKTVSVAPGSSVVLAELKGPATIQQLQAKLASKERWARRKVLLQMFWDGAEKAAVEAPIGDFFGDAWGEDTYKSLPMGITEDLDYSYWRMPFARSGKIVVVNQGRMPAEVRYRIACKAGELAPNTALFHAGWRRDSQSKDFDYPFLECTGRGRFVGAVLFPDNIIGGWWGEGDEKVWVDGEKFPSTFGTGSEDYFGDAWGIRYFVNPYHGCVTRGEYNATRRQACYRWHIGDSIPFSTSFKMTIENYAGTEKHPIPNDYSSMAYWYQTAGGSDFFQSVSVDGRIPRGPTHAGAIEAETLVPADKPLAGAEVVTDDALPEQLSNGKGLRISGKIGTTVPLALPAPDNGRFAIDARLAKGVKASEFEFLQDGKALGDWTRLSKGQNRIEVRLTGKPVEGDRCEVILDCLILAPYQNFVRNWYLIGPFDNAAKAGFDKAYGPETEPFKADQSFAGKKGRVSWREIRAGSGIVTSEEGHYFKDNENIVLYACCDVISPDTREATAYTGSDDGIKVWVNGKLVHANNADRGLRADQDRFEVALNKGRNTILVKVTQGEGPWGLTFRINDPDDQLKYALP